jgi:hypothetical protein
MILQLLLRNEKIHFPPTLQCIFLADFCPFKGKIKNPS